jgi:hypothetical protein
MFHNLSGAFQRTHLADAGDVSTIPLDAEFEILVGVKALSVYCELCH